MTFHADVVALKERLEDLETIGQLRTYLIQKDLRLVVTFFSTGFTCMDWNVSEKQVKGILHLGVKIKLSKISGGNDCLETDAISSVHLKEADWIDQNDLFDKIKQGIKTGIKKA